MLQLMTFLISIYHHVSVVDVAALDNHILLLSFQTTPATRAWDGASRFGPTMVVAACRVAKLARSSRAIENACLVADDYSREFAASAPSTRKMWIGCSAAHSFRIYHY